MGWGGVLWYGGDFYYSIQVVAGGGFGQFSGRGISIVTASIDPATIDNYSASVTGSLLTIVQNTPLNIEVISPPSSSNRVSQSFDQIDLLPAPTTITYSMSCEVTEVTANSDRQEITTGIFLRVVNGNTSSVVRQVSDQVILSLAQPVGTTDSRSGVLTLP